MLFMFSKDVSLFNNLSALCASGLDFNDGYLGRTHSSVGNCVRSQQFPLTFDFLGGT